MNKHNHEQLSPEMVEFITKLQSRLQVAIHGVLDELGDDAMRLNPTPCTIAVEMGQVMAAVLFDRVRPEGEELVMSEEVFNGMQHLGEHIVEGWCYACQSLKNPARFETKENDTNADASVMPPGSMLQ